jgi:uncharacterized protein (DUF4415 family)
MREDRYTDAPPEIAEAIMSAVEIADDFPPPEELRRQLKKSVTLRLDPDVYHWFKKPGSGYQTRINAVLRAYMNSIQTRETKSSSFSKVAAKKPARPTTKPVTAVSHTRRAAKKASPAKSR